MNKIGLFTDPAELEFIFLFSWLFMGKIQAE